MAENSNYKCPECDSPTQNLPGYPYRRIGVKHNFGCKFYAMLVICFPKLMERIKEEQENFFD